MQLEKNTEIENSAAKEIIAGLTSKQKTLPSKLFYDEKGSKLFDKICELPEYYSTRTEIKIIEENIKEIVSLFDEDLNILERLNEEFGFNFKTADFMHKAEYNFSADRIEMFLCSKTEQRISGLGEKFKFQKGNRFSTSIRTNTRRKDL